MSHLAQSSFDLVFIGLPNMECATKKGRGEAQKVTMKARGSPGLFD